eukprot:TRINITY_DN2531_c0_g1_i1.p1 TRINITY_DN2531_c0_g1~~TRINITY_DN2531_c0_g1_i1.p1  ORF type:complete len:208 (+),score=12.76 TRINITY_DN2531_c0_g1_i1:273-896(+)
MQTRGPNRASGVKTSPAAPNIAPHSPLIRSRPGEHKPTVGTQALHPDAVRRESERLERQRQRKELCAVEKTGRWWEGATPANLLFVHNPTDFVQSVAVANMKKSLVVVHYFHPECIGCKAMHPKLMQIIESNKDVTFIKVNTHDEEMQKHCTKMGLNSLPYFQFYREGRLTSYFTCNLTTINRFRAELAAALKSEATKLVPNAQYFQ